MMAAIASWGIRPEFDPGETVGPVGDAAHLENQRAWSAATFGPGPRIEHIEDH